MKIYSCAIKEIGAWRQILAEPSNRTHKIAIPRKKSLPPDLMRPPHDLIPPNIIPLSLPDPQPPLHALKHTQGCEECALVAFYIDFLSLPCFTLILYLSQCLALVCSAGETVLPSSSTAVVVFPTTWFHKTCENYYTILDDFLRFLPFLLVTNKHQLQQISQIFI